MQADALFKGILNRECAHFTTYSKLYRAEKDERRRDMLKKLINVEKRHIKMWCTMSGEKLPAQHGGVLTSSFFVAARRLFGGVITYKLISLYENFGLSDLFKAVDVAPEEKLELLVDIILDEIYNERMIINNGQETGFISHIRDVIFGMNDGLVEILGTAAGLVGIYKSNYITAIAGIIVGVSGTLSMAVGAYLSSKSERDVYSSESNRIKLEIASVVKRAQRELRLEPYAEGKNLTELIRKLKSRGNPLYKLLVKAKQSETAAIGNAERSNATPLKDGIYVGVFYFFGALIPLISFIFGTALNNSPTNNLVLSVVLTTIVMAATTAMIALGTHKNVLKNVAEYVLLSLSTAGITYFIGNLISFYLKVTI